jgi:hypothetical protein
MSREIIKVHVNMYVLIISLDNAGNLTLGGSGAICLLDVDLKLEKGIFTFSCSNESFTSY